MSESKDRRVVKFLEDLAVADELFMSSEYINGKTLLIVELSNGMMGQGKTLYDALMELSGNILDINLAGRSDSNQREKTLTAIKKWGVDKNPMFTDFPHFIPLGDQEDE